MHATNKEGAGRWEVGKPAGVFENIWGSVRDIGLPNGYKKGVSHIPKIVFRLAQIIFR